MPESLAHNNFHEIYVFFFNLLRIPTGWLAWADAPWH